MRLKQMTWLTMLASVSWLAGCCTKTVAPQVEAVSTPTPEPVQAWVEHAQESVVFLAHVRIKTEGVDVDRWLAIPDTHEANGEPSGGGYFDAASGQTVRITFTRNRGETPWRVALKLSDTKRMVYDHTIYGYQFPRGTTGVLKPWSGYDKAKGHYEFAGWEEPDGLRLVQPAVEPMLAVTLDVGSLNSGVVSLAASGEAELYLDRDAETPATPEQLTWDLLTQMPPTMIYVRPTSAQQEMITVTATHNTGVDVFVMSSLTIMQSSAVPPIAN